MLTDTLELLLGNFGLVMLVLALLMSILQIVLTQNRVSKSEIVFWWVILLAVGVNGIYTFILHAFFSTYSAAHIGWQPSPFQYEVAIADLLIGVLGLLSLRATYGFRLATVVACVIWFWGDAIGHVYQMVKFHNFANGNAGSWFWLDVLIPIILLICIENLRRDQRARK